MIKLFIRIFFILACFVYTTNTYANFKGYIGGVAFSSQTEVTGSISSAGGGIILRGIAKPVKNCTSCEILQVILLDNQHLSSVKVNTKKCTVSYTAPNWLIKDAAMLVNSETSTVYRNVNLLSQPTKDELYDIISKQIPEIEGMWSQNIGKLFEVSIATISKYFFIEVSKPLIGTKSGEVLLVVDLILTDPEFYSKFDLERSKNIINLPKVNLMDINKDEAVKKYEYVLKTFIDEKIKNWTWTDERANFEFTVSCDSNKLLITGIPSFTFLNKDKEVLVDTTRYFEINRNVIEDLNPLIFKYANNFSRISSFFRYLKLNKPELWNDVLNCASTFPESIGSTPRIIER